MQGDIKTRNTKVEGLRPQGINTMKKFNGNSIKSNVITALVFSIIFFIWGYHTSIDIHQQARASVVQDMQLIENTTAKK